MNACGGLHLCVYDLFNAAATATDYIVSDCRMIKDVEGNIYGII
jgi:hypothetical protein